MLINFLLKNMYCKFNIIIQYNSTLKKKEINPDFSFDTIKITTKLVHPYCRLSASNRNLYYKGKDKTKRRIIQFDKIIIRKYKPEINHKNEP